MKGPVALFRTCYWYYSKSNSKRMFKNYLNITLRTLFKEKLHSTINIVGLAIGIVVFIYLQGYISYERSFDSFHEDSEDIYRIASNRFEGGELTRKSIGTVPTFFALLDSIFPEIEHYTFLYNDGSYTVQAVGSDYGIPFEEVKAYYANEDFFKVFSFDLIQGNPTSVLEGSRKMVLSESAARKYFGNQNPIGKTLRITGQQEVLYEVTGVYADVPTNSHLRPDMLFSFETYHRVVRPEWNVLGNWIWDGFPTYIKLKTQDYQAVQKHINEVAQRTWGSFYQKRDVNFEFILQPLEKIHTTSNYDNEFELNTSAGMLTWLNIVSIVTLIIAWINYANLSIVKSLKRAKEVGLRKMFGANRVHLLGQFMVEAMVVNGMAIGIALFGLTIFNEGFTTWLNIAFPFEWSMDVLGLLLITFFGGLLATVFAVLLAIKYQGKSILSNQFDQSRLGKVLRTTLICFQFVFTPLIIEATYLVYQQTDHLLNQNLGFATDQVLVIKGPKGIYPNISSNFDYLKQEAERSPSIAHFTSLANFPGDPQISYSPFRVHGDSTGSKMMYRNFVEYDFEKVFGLEVIAGRSYDPSFEDSTALVVNESFVKSWGYSPKDFIGKTLSWRYTPSIPTLNKRIIGVIKDYKQEAYSNEIKPMFYTLRRYTPARQTAEYYAARLNFESNFTSTLLRKEIDRLESLWLEVFPNDPFNYYFLDADYQQKFESELQLTRVMSAFSILAIGIAAIGLFSVSSFVLIQRRKEFGIRKVLGASSLRITRSVLFQYSKLITISFLLASPILYYLGNDWLNHYEVRMQINSVTYVLPLVVSLMIGLGSVLVQTISASVRNPVEVLRYE